jgi:hypothetical protein
MATPLRSTRSGPLFGCGVALNAQFLFHLMHYLYKDFSFEQFTGYRVRLSECLARAASYVDGCALQGKWTLANNYPG